MPKRRSRKSRLFESHEFFDITNFYVSMYVSTYGSRYLEFVRSNLKRNIKRFWLFRGGFANECPNFSNDVMHAMKPLRIQRYDYYFPINISLVVSIFDRKISNISVRLKYRNTILICVCVCIYTSLDINIYLFLLSIS